MLTKSQAKLVLQVSGLSREDKVLILLSVGDAAVLRPAVIRDLGEGLGVSGIKKWNISDILSKAGSLVLNVGTGWELSETGSNRVRELAVKANINLVVTNSSESLRGHLSVIANDATRQFAQEAIACFEARQYRAAVVFSWAGAISLLYDHVCSSHLVAFNAEASKRPRWRNAKNADGLARMGDHDFLDVLEAIGEIGKSTKQMLQNQCLTLRNGCAHPSSSRVAENSVAAHIEKLILNVFSKY